VNLYLDIETIPSQSRAVREDIAKNILPPGNISKAETIAAWVKEKKPAAVDEAIAKTALDGALGHICCIGWALDGADPQSVVLDTESSEADIIEAFVAKVDDAVVHQPTPPVIIGHHVVGFDIRFIWQRAIALGIRLPGWFPRDPRPWDGSVFDTMAAWAGYRGWISLNKLCEAVGLEGKGDIDGSMVAKMWADAEYTRISDYCKADVERVRAVHRRMRVAFGEMAA
jgi:3'-5' exonuclease